MRCEDLSPGDLREPVEHYRTSKERAGGGWTYVRTQLADVWCAFEERPPVNRITGEVLTQGTTGQMGVRTEVDIQPEDIIVRNDQAWRVIGPTRKPRARFTLWHLERVDPGQIPEATT